MSEYDRIARSQGIVIADEALGLRGVVAQKVVCPAKADRLVPEFRFDVERAVCVTHPDGILHTVLAGGEGGIVGGLANHGDLGRCSLLVEAGGQKAIVFHVAHGMKEPGGHLSGLVFHDVFVNLHLVAAFDLAVVRLEARGSSSLSLPTMEPSGLSLPDSKTTWPRHRAPRSAAMHGATDRQSAACVRSGSARLPRR